MRRHKKLIVATVLATVLVVGSIGGIALADKNGDDSGPAAHSSGLYGIKSVQSTKRRQATPSTKKRSKEPFQMRSVRGANALLFIIPPPPLSFEGSALNGESPEGEEEGGGEVDPVRKSNGVDK